MNTSNLTFTANDQELVKNSGLEEYASNSVSYIKATFTLGENWSGFDSVRAVWSSYYNIISTVLDTNNSCLVPAEMLLHKSEVKVNLVGSIVENNVLTDRLTTFPIKALKVSADAQVNGTETAPVSPSQFEQFVNSVEAAAQSVTDYSYDSEAWAKGTRGGVAVPSTDETYHNNSKYYADQGAELSQEVTNLKSDLARLDNLSYDIEDYAMPISWFERGGLNNGVNDSYREGSRARNKSIVSFDSITSVTVTNGDFGVTYYNNNDQFSSWGGWKTSSDVVTIPKGQKFRLMFSLNKSASASQVDSLESMVAILRFKTDYNQPHTVQEYGMSFEHGSLNNGADDTYNGGARIRNRRIMQFPYSIAVSMQSGVYSIHFYHDDDSFAYALGWRSTEEYIIPPNAKFRMVLANATTASAYADIAPLLDNLTITPLRCENIVAPNIVYQSRNVEDTIYPPYSKWYIQASARNQYDRVRFNIRKTTDGYYFLCHDDTINAEARNADGSTIGTSISTNGRTLAELNSYDWGIKYGSYYAGAKVPMLEDALKYSALYNLGVTVEFSSLSGWTDTDTANVIALFDKYGVTEKLIVIDPQGTNLTFLQKFTDHNESISVYVGANQTWWGTSANVANVKALHTNYNKVYVQLYPWGTLPSAEFIALAKANDFTLYNSTVMSKSDLLTVDIFNKGFNLIEANNVFAIKDTVRRWADSLVDA